MLKFIAILTMLIDHIGIALIPSTTPLYWICRVVGRIAMPIFCYKIALGFIHTRNLSKYAYRILLMTLCAQIPFAWLALGLPPSAYWLGAWNVGLTFLCGLAFLKCYTGSQNTLLKSLTLLLILIISSFGDYGPYGVLMILLFYYQITYKLSFPLIALLLTLLTYFFYGLGGISSLFFLQLASLGGLICIRYLPDQPMPYLSRYFFYSFYPLHMLILALMRDIFMA